MEKKKERKEKDILKNFQMIAVPRFMHFFHNKGNEFSNRESKSIKIMPILSNWVKFDSSFFRFCVEF